MKNKNAVFESMPVPRAVATLAIPTVLSMLVTVIYNMADTYFVGQTGDPNQVAAVSLTMPIFMVLMAIGNMFGIGGSSYISRLLGEGQKKKVKNVSSFCFYGCIGTGIIMIVVFLLGMDWLLKLIGASQNTFAYAKSYLTYIAIGAPFVIISNAFSNIVRGEGAAKVAMIGMMLGTIVNIILDPIMILSMGMGVSGAALATIIGNIASTVFYIMYFLRGKSSLSISPKEFRINGIAKGVLSTGIPATINNILMSLANIMLNNFLVIYGDIPVAAMGVALKANMLVIMLQLGLAMGIQPLVGYNYGSGNYKRMKSVMKFSIGCTFIIGSVLTLIYYFGARQIISMFISDNAVIENGVSMLRALMVSGPVIGILFVFMFTMQAMGKALPSLILSLSRQGVVFLPVLFIANKLFKLDGIIFAQPIADSTSVLISAFIFFIISKRLKDVDEHTPNINDI